MKIEYIVVIVVGSIGIWNLRMMQTSSKNWLSETDKEEIISTLLCVFALLCVFYEFKGCMSFQSNSTWTILEVNEFFYLL